MKIKQLVATTGLTILGLAAASSVLAASKSEIDQRVSDSLTQFHAMNAANKSLSGKSAGMLVFPLVTKGGVGVAAEHGDGVLQINGKTVEYYSVSAASVGLTLGLAQHSEIIMFMTRDSLDKFRATNGWSMGADAGITIVRANANGEYDTKVDQKPILAFQYGDKGLLGDLSIEGEKVSKLKDFH
jgi:lipid-binding SYLF domain-containing protein